MQGSIGFSHKKNITVAYPVGSWIINIFLVIVKFDIVLAHPLTFA
jgi:hypothetical protein